MNGKWQGEQRCYNLESCSFTLAMAKIHRLTQILLTCSLSRWIWGLRSSYKRLAKQTGKHIRGEHFTVSRYCKMFSYINITYINISITYICIIISITYISISITYISITYISISITYISITYIVLLYQYHHTVKCKMLSSCCVFNNCTLNIESISTGWLYYLSVILSK